MSSGAFFDGMRAVDVDGVRKFYKGPTEILEFPDRLTVQVKARVIDCFASPPRSVDEHAARTALSLVTFKIGWKTGSQVRQIKDFSVDLVSPHVEPMQESGPGPDVWTYVIVLRPKAVPLTDHLIIEVDVHGKFCTQLSGRL